MERETRGGARAPVLFRSGERTAEDHRPRLRLIICLYELEAKWDGVEVGDKRAALRQKMFAMPLRRSRWLVTALQARMLPKPGLGEACADLLGHWLTAHLRSSHTRLDTNRVENAMVESMAEEMAQRHSARHGFRTYDLLHVVFARLLDCDHFFSFDRRARQLATLEGLKMAE